MTNTNEVTYDNRVMFAVAMADKRRQYLADWFRSHELVLDGSTIDDRAYWADNIMRLNDAELAVRRLLEPTAYEATMASLGVAA